MIKIEYDGKYPNLCSGNLVVFVDNVGWEFGSCMCSGGEVTSDEDWNFEVTDGPWSIFDWPVGFPDELKDDVLDEINSSVTWGCCGGCI
jgi:hypothetical protein